MSTTVFASIKARIAGVTLINSGLFDSISLRRVSSTDIMAHLESSLSSGEYSQYDGKAIFHRKVESIYKYSPRSVRLFIEALCLDLVRDLLKSQIRYLHHNRLNQSSLSSNISAKESRSIFSSFVSPEHELSIKSITSLQDLEPIISELFECTDFSFDTEETNRKHEERLDRIYFNRVLSAFAKAPYVCRRHLLCLFRVRLVQYTNNVEHRFAYHQLDPVELPVPRNGFFAKNHFNRDENRYLPLLIKALRRSPLTPLPIFAYIFILELWCNRVAGLLSRAEVEPQRV